MLALFAPKFCLLLYSPSGLTEPGCCPSAKIIIKPCFIREFHIRSCCGGTTCHACAIMETLMTYITYTVDKTIIMRNNEKDKNTVLWRAFPSSFDASWL